MTSLFTLISRFFTSVRNLFFLALFLMSANYHQALEKFDLDRLAEADLTFLYEPVVSFHPEYAEYIEKEIDALLQRRRFNGSVMVAHQGKAVYNKSLGTANFPRRIEFAESDNVFQLASVGKQFTAMAVLLLQERGMVQLDDPVHLHIEGFPYEDITIRMMLNHTSGLQNYMYLMDRFWAHDHLPVHADMLEMMVSRNLPLNFTPGRRFSYSNTGYAFLAMLVHEVSGEPFHEFVNNHIFIPLGMNNSFVFHPDLPIDQMLANGVAAGHDRRGRSLRAIPVDHIDGITGDKGIFSTTEDLLKWDNAIEMNLLISEETKAMAFDRGRLRSGYAINYGFGYRLRRQGEDNIVYHNGWWRGFRTTYVRLPGNTLIVILNNTNASINSLDRQIMNLINASPYPVTKEEEELLAMESLQFPLPGKPA